MPSKISAEIKGLKETQRNLEKAVSDLRGTPVLNAMRDATLLVERDAKRGLVGYQSPSVGGVNTGRVRASITPEVKTQGAEVVGVVGSNVKYAPYVEFDTKPHWPYDKTVSKENQPIVLWARRHHADPFLVARAISRRGTIGKHFLQKAFDGNKGKIEGYFQKAVKKITEDANK